MKFGNTFSDNLIIQSKVSSLIPKTKSHRWWQGAGRVLLLAIILWGGLFILGSRLFSLTVIDGHRFRALADDNRTRDLVRHAPRGILYDRKGTALVENIARFRLLSPCPTKPETLCISHISEEKGKQMEIDGLPAQHFLEVDYQRKYLFPESTAHVVGYTGEINAQELDDEYYQLRKYLKGDQIGRSASEVVFEDRLRGRNGRELVEVDANGRILRVLGRDQELPGEDIHLSIDAHLSEVIAKAFPKQYRGAVVVTNPSTGEILAMYSSPTFSLNNFSLGMSQEDYEEFIENVNRPLFNRAIGGIYPPASTYKTLGSWAALEEGVITKDTLIEDTGVITIGPFQFHNWYFTQYGGKDGMVDVTKGIARSNDIFFYKVGEMLGVTKLREWSLKMGLGKKLGIELPGEAEGVLPGPEWKKNQFSTNRDLEMRNNEWYVGDTYHMAIGQGYLLTTPLQVNNWTAVIANGGKFCKPTILKVNGKRSDTDCHTIPISKETRKLVMTGMRKACEPEGTAYPLFHYSVPLDSQDASSSAKKFIPIACKTGTAEFGSPTNKTHAWITAVAPIPTEYINNDDTAKENMVSGEPELSITVLVEEGGEGSAMAGPIAKAILDYWFTR